VKASWKQTYPLSCLTQPSSRFLLLIKSELAVTLDVYSVAHTCHNGTVDRFPDMAIFTKRDANFQHQCTENNSLKTICCDIIRK